MQQVLRWGSSALLLTLTLAACAQQRSTLIQNTSQVKTQVLSLSDGLYEIVSRADGKALDVKDAAGQDGAPVQQWTNFHNRNQRWQLTKQGDGSFRIAAQHSGKVLDVYGASAADGAAVVQWTWNGGDNQRWTISETDGGFVKLSAKHSGKILDVTGVSSNDGALLQQWQDYGNTNQQFRLVRVDGAGTPAPAQDPPVLDQSGQLIEIKAPPASEGVPTGAVFVSPKGSDDGDGSQAKPYKTLKRALAAARGGATVVLRGGTYRLGETVNVSNNVRTVQAYPGEQVWLKGSAVVTGWVQDGGAWRKDGWTAKFTPLTGDGVQSNYPEAGHLDMAYLDGRALRQVMRREDVTAGSFYVDEANQKLYVGDNPGGHTVEATVADIGMTSSGAELGTTVRGLGFAHFASMGFDVTQHQTRVLDNTFVWNGRQGALAHPTLSSNSVFKGNTFSFNGEQGLGGHRTDGTRVENNTFTYNNQDHFSHGWGAAGVKFCASKGLIFKNNVASHNDGNGIWLDCGVNDVTVVGNTVQGNSVIGIHFEISKGAIIADNLITGNGARYNDPGIQIANSANAQIYNNTLVGNRVSLQILGGTRAPSDLDTGLPVNYVAEHLVIKNNIFADATNTAWPKAHIDAIKNQDRSDTAPMVDAMDHNAYLRSNAAQPYHVVRWMPFAREGNEQQFKTLADFQAGVGFEAHGLALDNAPLASTFVNPAAGDYRLKDGSSLKGAGEGLPQDVADALGVPAGQAVDLGVLGQ